MGQQHHALDVVVKHWDIFLPVGIFFLHVPEHKLYYRPLSRPHQTTTSLDRLRLYVSFFPQLCCRPYRPCTWFHTRRSIAIRSSRGQRWEGLFLIICGLFKKAVISDYISLNFVDRVFDQPLLYSGLENLFGVYGYTLQIYCDFSGLFWHGDWHRIAARLPFQHQLRFALSGANYNRSSGVVGTFPCLHGWRITSIYRSEETAKVGSACIWIFWSRCSSADCGTVQPSDSFFGECFTAFRLRSISFYAPFRLDESRRGDETVAQSVLGVIFLSIWSASVGFCSVLPIWRR